MHNGCVRYYLHVQYRVGYILNITREIDNFYPEVFKYLNIRYTSLSYALCISYSTEIKLYAI